MEVDVAPAGEQSLVPQHFLFQPLHFVVSAASAKQVAPRVTMVHVLHGAVFETVLLARLRCASVIHSLVMFVPALGQNRFRDKHPAEKND